MSSESSQVRLRAPKLDFVEKRRGNALVGRFVDRFGRWHQRTAFLTAALTSGSPTQKERDEHLSELKELAREVEAFHLDFEHTVAGAAPQGRIDDVRLAFTRLRGMLHNWTRGSVSN